MKFSLFPLMVASILGSINAQICNSYQTHLIHMGRVPRTFIYTSNQFGLYNPYFRCYYNRQNAAISGYQSYNIYSSNLQHYNSINLNINHNSGYGVGGGFGYNSGGSVGNIFGGDTIISNTNNNINNYNIEDNNYHTSNNFNGGASTGGIPWIEPHRDGYNDFNSNNYDSAATYSTESNWIPLNQGTDYNSGSDYSNEGNFDKTSEFNSGSDFHRESNFNEGSDFNGGSDNNSESSFNVESDIDSESSFNDGSDDDTGV